MRKICKKIAIILSLLLMLYSPIQVFGLSKDKDIAREAHYAIAFDTESREILYEKKAFDNVPMASTTKILTAILAINYGNLDDPPICSAIAIAASFPDLYIRPKSSSLSFISSPAL